MASTCPTCGTSVRPQARFCPHCGRSLDEGLGPGSMLNHGAYRIVRSLSKGGMGAVYLAEDCGAFDRLCVVKQMIDYYDPTDAAERTKARQRFEEEGRTLASLSHPGVPKIYAFFVEAGRHYIVMEHIQGRDLESCVTHQDRSGQLHTPSRLPQEQVIRYVIQVCRILEYLHSQKRPVVHQDVKPANLILESQLGDVRLVDFGTARAEIPQGARPQSSRSATPRLRERLLGRRGKAPATSTPIDSSVYGTDGYAAPEQYRGQPVPRSDVFALAATAYHLMTDDDPRDHPFKWPRIEDLPKEVTVALKRALRARPEQRSTADELRHALEAITTPKRVFESFTFPGGASIRSVGSLPALCDEHWDAARSFLYEGDFARWLRDINRLDLVAVAERVCAKEENRDCGLERFLNAVDHGLAQPRIATDPPQIALGAIARESAIVRKATVLNVTRGYTLGKVTASEPWIEVYPEAVHLWAGIPADVRISVRAEMLPFRSKQSGLVCIEADGTAPVEVPITARVSLMREAWRILVRTIGAALPESWRRLGQAWNLVARSATVAIGPFVRFPWLVALIWVALAGGFGYLLYRFPEDIGALPIIGALLVPTLGSSDTLTLFLSIVVRAGLAPPVMISTLWLIYLSLALLVGAVWGACHGAWKSFFR